MQPDDELLADLAEDDLDAPPTPTAKLSDNEIEERYANISLRVIYQTNNFFLPQIQNLINGKEVLNLRPEYQRRLRWTQKKKSQLIESLLLNIPVPPVFFYESDLARYEVMDGQQRLNAIHDYLENNFKLTGLETLSFLSGKSFKQLPPKVRRGLERASISAIVLLQETKSDKSDPFIVRRYVFERLNTGGEKLNPQEIRNSLYRGPFNEMIVSLARNDTFCSIFQIPKYTETDESEYYENSDRQKNSLYSRMNDCQIVLRFFALLDDSNIKGSMRSILDKCMKDNSDTAPETISKNKALFAETIQVCSDIFDGVPFSLPPDDKGRRRVSIGLYDALMVGIYRCGKDADDLRVAKRKLKNAITAEVRANVELFTGKANTAQSIKDRIGKVVSTIKATL